MPTSPRPEPHPRPSRRELIVVARAGVEFRAPTAAETQRAALAAALKAAGATLRPLFGASEATLRQAAAEALQAAERETEPPRLDRFHAVDAPDARLDALAAQLRKDPGVEAAYVKPGAVPAVFRPAGLARAALAAGATPDFTPRQTYLEAGPAGLDARHAWRQQGGTGAGARIVDVEGAWRFEHEDLRVKAGGVIAGTEITEPGWEDHGTAVIGVMSGDGNAFGITGICPDAVVSASSIEPAGSAPAIRAAADALAPGDVLVVELHRPGPRTGFVDTGDQFGFIPVEWWPDDFEAIRYATLRGVVVVSAAGNGQQNLADPLYDANPGFFPSWWRNPFRRDPLDSGSILVGAGAPPGGFLADRSRLFFSNFGPPVDAQAYGTGVVTTGFGDLQGSADGNRSYTAAFGGTSSATPMVAGAAACVQGTLRAAGRNVLTPSRVRALLRETGWPQQDGAEGSVSQRIGSRPDIKQLLERAGAETTYSSVPLYQYWNATIGNHFYTFNFHELGAPGYVYERIACWVFMRPHPGTTPLHRYWNAGATDHFYTTRYDELGAGAHGWVYEKKACHVLKRPAQGTVRLHRYWNVRRGDHYYTTNFNELGNGARGWVYEGVACHVYPRRVTFPLGTAPTGLAAADDAAEKVPAPPTAAFAEAGAG